MAVLKGAARRQHLDAIRKSLVVSMRTLAHRHMSQISGFECYHAMLLALEDYARLSAEEIRDGGTQCADKYCREES